MQLSFLSASGKNDGCKNPLNPEVTCIRKERVNSVAHPSWALHEKNDDFENHFIKEKPHKKFDSKKRQFH